jgi:hypothetical protein
MLPERVSRRAIHERIAAWWACWFQAGIPVFRPAFRHHPIQYCTANGMWSLGRGAVGIAGRLVPAADWGSGCRTLLGFSRVRVFSNVARILPSLKILSGSESASPRKHLRTMKLSLTSPQRRRGGMRIQKKAAPLKIIRVRQVNSLSSENFRPLPSGSLYPANSEHGVQGDAVLFQMNK